MEQLNAFFNRPVDQKMAARAAAMTEATPGLRRRDLAEKLEVSEAELVEAQFGLRSVRLKPDFRELVQRMPELGYVMSLTRNQYVVHERKGVYQNLRLNGPVGLVIADDRKIDLRIVFKYWAHGFAIEEDTPNGLRYSLQFFDQAGVAIQKIFMQPESEAEGWLNLMRDFIADDQQQVLQWQPVTDLPEYIADEQIDADKLRQDWQKMTDVHQLFGILKRHQISREQAFRVIGDENARPFDPAKLETVLHRASEQQLPLMCFVGNHGNIQIHTGPVNQIKRMGPWLNVLDPEFNLHLLEEGVKSAWLVRKPTVDGVVTSLECYGAESELLVQFFGVRQEGEAENLQWRALAESVVEQEVAA